jgi:hypothetical protein
MTRSCFQSNVNLACHHSGGRLRKLVRVDQTQEGTVFKLVRVNRRRLLDVVDEVAALKGRRKRFARLLRGSLPLFPEIQWVGTLCPSLSH